MDRQTNRMASYLLSSAMVAVTRAEGRSPVSLATDLSKIVMRSILPVRSLGQKRTCLNIVKELGEHLVVDVLGIDPANRV
jgi:hypothetical protein